MASQTHLSPTAIIQRLNDAINQHDLEMFVGCFDAKYQSEQPVYPNRAFTGSEQVRKNWSSLFASVPDLRSELLRLALSGTTAWCEWHWQGTRLDASSFNMTGVIIFGTANSRIIWGRLYMEQIEEDSDAIDASVRKLTGE